MVSLRPLRFALALALALPALLPTQAAAQNYATSDTLTEYPNSGTWYHNRFEGRKTASGEVFDQNKFTAAHWKIKLGTYVMVTNQNTGLQVIVRVNDRCPKRGVFDMSHRAANAIGIRGCQPVTVRLLPDSVYHDRWAAQEAMFDSVATTLIGGKKASATASKKKKTTAKQQSTTAARRRAPTFHLILDTVANQAEAAVRIAELPLPYQGQVESVSIGGGRLALRLPLGLTEKKATDLRRSLLHSFPHCALEKIEQ